MKTIEIFDTESDKLKVEPDSLKVSVHNDKEVKWKSRLPDWCVVFGPNEPIHPKVATPDNPKVTLKAGRPEDLKHVKYTVVGWTGAALKHDDPELIVDE